MSDLTDEQQVERLKAWWQENGRSLMFIIGIGIVGAIGWLKWQDGQRVESESASVLYEAAMAAADRNDTIVLGQRLDELTEEYGESSYATLGVMRLAAILLANGEADEAKVQLEALLKAQKDSELAPLIAFRLARIELYLGNAEAAMTVLDGTRPGKFEPLFLEAKGDAYIVMGQDADARSAYQAAIDNPGQPQMIDVGYVDIKLAELATSSDGESETP